MLASGGLTREQIASWLDILIGQATLYAPKWIDGTIRYGSLTSSTELIWDYSRPILSIKEFFFPPTESLFRIEKIGPKVEFNETLPVDRQILFGVRPCDARGIRMLDSVFLGQAPVDPYYAERRKNTTIIGLACKELGDYCFCTSTGGSPHSSEDVDLFLTEVDGEYAVDIVTEKGAQALEQLPDSRPETTVQTRQILAGVQPGNIHRLVELEAWPTFFEDEYWQKVAERCLSCRICAYVCPTCRCFDVRDERTNKGSIERLRCWDSCTGVGYRRIAGGHNPRATSGERLRNRFFCKFYYFPLQYGLASSACTGCGRCIAYCPVNIDITEVLDYLAARLGDGVELESA